MPQQIKTCRRKIVDDEFFTMYKDVVRELHKYDLRGKRIICPCDNRESNIYKYLKDCYYNVKCDATEWRDIDYSQYDVVITNPPFSKKDKILKRLDELGKPFAILLPMNSLQGQSRYKVFKKGIQLLAFDKRIGFHTNGNMQTTAEGNHFASAYFCRGILPRDLILEELVKYERPLIVE